MKSQTLQVNQKEENRLHFKFLDGLRGFAAFYVVLFHVIAKGNENLFTEKFYLFFLQFGHEAVVVFIVLSGFVLTLPVAQSHAITLRGGISGFFKKRARRILPAYYAALFLIPAFLLIIEVVKQFTGEGADWERIRQLFLSPNMLSHLFLLHNLSDAWAYSMDLNVILWSMATEWWSYVIFALFLIPIWRSLGIFAALITSISLGMIPSLLKLLSLPSLSGFPYLLGAFGLGMTSASFLVEEKYRGFLSTRMKILEKIALLAFALFCGFSILTPSIRLNPETRWITDMLLAVACSVVILECAPKSLHHIPPRQINLLARKFLESPPLIWLGSFSYSIYLTHLAFIYILGTFLNLQPVKNLIAISLEPMPIRIYVLIPLILGFSYGFYLLFEKPFLKQPLHMQSHKLLRFV